MNLLRSMLTSVFCVKKPPGKMGQNMLSLRQQYTGDLDGPFILLGMSQLRCLRAGLLLCCSRRWHRHNNYVIEERGVIPGQIVFCLFVKKNGFKLWERKWNLQGMEGNRERRKDQQVCREFQTKGRRQPRPKYLQCPEHTGIHHLYSLSMPLLRMALFKVSH